jgi:molecular chaperone GrpE
MTKKTKNKKVSSKINKEDEVKNEMKEELIENGKEDQALADIEALKEELAEANDAKLRALAEVENMRRRMEKEKQENARYGASNLAKGLFSVLDNFDRALMASPKDLKNKKDIEKNYISLHEGVELTVKEILTALKQNGIEVISPSKGDVFDHNVHQAMLEVPTNEFEPGCVCEVLQSGYKIYDRLLRPAMVGVSKKES